MRTPVENEAPEQIEKMHFQDTIYTTAEERVVIALVVFLEAITVTIITASPVLWQEEISPVT